MIDSTQYHEVYNTTGEILQNIQPITTIEYLSTFFIFTILFFCLKNSLLKKISNMFSS